MPKLLLGFAIVLLHLNETEQGRSIRSSSYQPATGAFLVQQLDLPDTTFQHGGPHHLEELRSIHKIKNRVKRDAVLSYRTLRVERSTQGNFPWKMRFNPTESQRVQDATTVKTPTAVTFASLPKPATNQGRGARAGSSATGDHSAVSVEEQGLASNATNVGHNVDYETPVVGVATIDDGELVAPDVTDTTIPAELEITTVSSTVTKTTPLVQQASTKSISEPILTVTKPTAKPSATPSTVVDSHGRPGELLLPENYNNLQIPKPDYGKSLGQYLPGPLICLIFMKILGISEINELEATVTFDIDFTVEWIDGLIFDVSEAFLRAPPTKKEILQAQKTLSPSFLKQLWRPDVYMQDLVKVQQPTINDKSVISLKFNKLEGFISYTVRMSITVNCAMSFEHYPADTQRCIFRLGSYSHSKDDMSLDWLILGRKLVGVVLDDDSEDNFDIKLDNIEKYEFTPKYNNPENKSFEILTFSLGARRKISYHLIQTYLPSMFNIFVTWLVFLIPYTLYDCRIGTTMTTLLTLTAMFSAVREQSPQVNYIKAIDLWMLACVLFIFLNLVELSVMTWMRITIETFEEMKEKAEEEAAGNRDDVEKAENLDLNKTVTPLKIHRLRLIYGFFSSYSFALFAGLFVLFNIGYWSWLFTASGYFSWVPND